MTKSPSRQGMSEREYARHCGLSRGAIQKAKWSDRLVLFPDGSIDPEASDRRLRATTDPAKSFAAKYGASLRAGRVRRLSPAELEEAVRRVAAALPRIVPPRR